MNNSPESSSFFAHQFRFGRRDKLLLNAFAQQNADEVSRLLKEGANPEVRRRRSMPPSPTIALRWPASCSGA